MKRVHNAYAGTAILLLSLGLANTHIASAGEYDTAENRERSVQNRTVKILPPSVSRSLKLNRIPQAQPLNIGTYWNCFEQGLGGFSDETVEICDLVLVVCTDDNEVCTEV